MTKQEQRIARNEAFWRRRHEFLCNVAGITIAVVSALGAAFCAWMMLRR